jgi:hypothetical protein
MEHHAWLIFIPSDHNGQESDERVKEIARHWMNDLPGERDPATETIDVRPDGMKVYRIVGDSVGWRAWMAREGPQALCSEHPEWEICSEVYEAPRLPHAE